jgi:hypothetical protein
MSDVNVVRERAGTILSDGINKYFLYFLCVLWPQFGNLIVTLCIAHNTAYFKTIFQTECSHGANYSHNCRSRPEGLQYNQSRTTAFVYISERECVF